MRRNHSDNFAKSLPSLCADVFPHKMQTVLPHRDRLGRRVFLFRAGIWDPSAVSPTDVFAANYICLEMMAREVKTQVRLLTVKGSLRSYLAVAILGYDKKL